MQPMLLDAIEIFLAGRKQGNELSFQFCIFVGHFGFIVMLLSLFYKSSFIDAAIFVISWNFFVSCCHFHIQDKEIKFPYFVLPMTISFNPLNPSHQYIFRNFTFGAEDTVMSAETILTNALKDRHK